MLLALETSCDETAAAICDSGGRILASEISTQMELHRPFGGVVPELASRNHLIRVQPLILSALTQAGVRLGQVEAFAATSGPGLASSLLIGSTVAKSLAMAAGRPFLGINHLEGHLLSPFIGRAEGISPGIALIVSGGHTMLLQLRGAGDYMLLGTTRDDAAGEAFDKGAKMLGLPYPGGPLIDKLAKVGDATAFEFPRSMLDSRDHHFSFSGLKTSLLYVLPKLPQPLSEECLADLCASYQEAIVEILVEKTTRAARKLGQRAVSISGGVSCNSRLREAMQERCDALGLRLYLAAPNNTTDNAAMIAYAAWHRFQRGQSSELTLDVDPNWRL